MRKLLAILLMLSLPFGVAFAANKASDQADQATPTKARKIEVPKVELKNAQDKLVYALGYETGRAFRSHNLLLKPKIFTAGVMAAVSDTPPLLTKPEMEKVMLAFQERTSKRMKSMAKAEAKVNLKKGNKFLSFNKGQPGVVTLPSGLQYKILVKGKGQKPNKSDVVVVNYEGKTTNGKVFDSSYKRNEAATFPISSVIPGWQKILPMMPVGSTWMVFVPPKLAYGQRGVPGVIAPNSTLIFKINLISIQK